MYYKFKHVTSIEMEITNYCNAFCGDCDRNTNGGKIRDNIILKHMPMESWHEIVKEENLKYIHTINFNGNYGDATMHPHFIEMLKYLNKVKPDLHILLSTNGGAQTTEFWKNLALTLSKFKYHKVNFSVDGTKETNHIYRRGVNWNKLTNNIKTFNNYNGISVLSTIVFDHNKHQLLELADAAEHLGCHSFQTRRNRSKNPMILDQYKNFPAGEITSPNIDEYYKKYNVTKLFKKSKYKYPYYTEPTDDVCPFGSQGKISIDNLANVWPCCFFYSGAKNFNNSFDYAKYYKYNSLLNNNLETILDFFHSDLSAAWKNKTYTLCENCLHKRNPPVSPKSRKVLK